MKKCIFTFIAVVSLLILSACTGKSSSDNPSEEQPSLGNSDTYTSSAADTTLNTTELITTNDTDETTAGTEASSETIATSEVLSQTIATSATTSQTTVTSAKATAEPQPEITAAVVAVAKSITSNDMRLNIGGAAYSLRGGVEPVFANLGNNYEYAESISCDHDGMDKTFIYSSAEFYTWPMPKRRCDM